MLHTALKMGAG
jgi:hypothetical protein